MNINYVSPQQTAYNEHNPATPVAEDHTYPTIWDEPAELAKQDQSFVEQTLTRVDDVGYNFSLVDNPQPEKSFGLLKMKSANEWIDEAKNRPMPSKLFGQLWFEKEVCILFAGSNVGKTILALQIADAISRGKKVMCLENNSTPQTVIYCDFELSDKQFELRYIGDNGEHYQFSENLKRIEIDSENCEYPDGYDFEDYLKESLQHVVDNTRAKVVIIDNITYLSNETDKSKDALRLMKWIKPFAKDYGLSILILAHTPKRSNSTPITKNDCFGSSMLQNFCDAMFAIGESAKDKQLRYIKELKQRNMPFAYDSENVIVCEICKIDNMLQFKFVEYGSESEHLFSNTDKNKEATIRRVKELSDSGKSQREIANELSISIGAVNKYLHK